MHNTAIVTVKSALFFQVLHVGNIY